MSEKTSYWHILEEVPRKSGYEQVYVLARCEAPTSDGTSCGVVRKVRFSTIERGESTCCGCLTNRRKYDFGRSIKAAELYQAAGVPRATFYRWLDLYGIETTLQKIREKVSSKVAKELGL